mmetsp:Transcript_26275/g.30446  ORF Transcript_26275/g.30446 Transcript_26275/m.30446 type:complete len:169 (-) Transcript_26275:20-526(-)
MNDKIGLQIMNKPASTYNSLDTNAQLIEEVYLKIKKRFRLFALMDVMLHLSLITVYWFVNQPEEHTLKEHLLSATTVGLLIKASIVLLPPLFLQLTALARINSTLLWIALGTNAVSTMIAIIYIFSLEDLWMCSAMLVPFKIFLYYLFIKLIMILKQKKELMLYVLTN